MNEAPAPATPQARRRSKRKAARTENLQAFTWLRKYWRRHLVTVMGLVTAGWLFQAYQETYTRTFVYDVVSAGNRDVDVLYFLGQPSRKDVRDGAPRWLYRDGDRVTFYTFEPDGELRNIYCSSLTGSPGACPPAHGIRLGMYEDDVWHRLGVPSVQKLRGPVKLISYPAIGLTLRLEQFRVAGIVRTPKASRINVIPSAIRALVP